MTETVTVISSPGESATTPEPPPDTAPTVLASESLEKVAAAEVEIAQIHATRDVEIAQIEADTEAARIAALPTIEIMAEELSECRTRILGLETALATLLTPPEPEPPPSPPEPPAEAPEPPSEATPPSEASPPAEPPPPRRRPSRWI